MDFSQIDRVIRHHGPGVVLAELAPFVSEARRQRIEGVLAGRLGSVHVACEHPEDPHNAAAVVRSAEAFGVMNVHVVGAPEGALHAQSTTQGAYYWVHTHHHVHTAACIAALRARGLLVAGATMTGRHALDELPSDRPLCVAFGNEGTGLSQAFLQACDLTFRIPMVGMSESLNLSVSAALTMYTITQHRRASLGRAGDLRGRAYLWEKARYYARSVEARLLDGLLPA